MSFQIHEENASVCHCIRSNHEVTPTKTSQPDIIYQDHNKNLTHKLIEIFRLRMENLKKSIDHLGLLIKVLITINFLSNLVS